MTKASAPPADNTESGAFDALLAGLSHPTAWGLEDDAPLRIIHTHISVVFLTPSRAYKLKKPVRFWNLLDYGTLDARRDMCEREVELNRRLAPDIYLGVVPIVREKTGFALWQSEKPAKADRVVDHVVEMTLVPEEASWAARVKGGHLDEGEVENLAKLMSDFHRDHRLPKGEASQTSPQKFARVLSSNFKASRSAVPEIFPKRVHTGLATRLARRLWRQRGRIRQRVAEGRAVDGHGDLRLEHVVRHQGRVAVMDCAEFSDWLRMIDPLSDIAFLSMDLTACGRPDLARALEVAYLEHSGEPDALPLMPLFRAYRAHVRAMVDVQTARDPDIDDRTRKTKLRQARRNLALAWSYSRSGATPPIVMFRGPSGSGKSVLAAAVAPWLRGHVERSDVVRKTLLGMSPTDRPDDGERALVYSDDMSRRTYEELERRGLAALERGQGALLDATFLRRASRNAVQTLAELHGAPFAIVDVRTDPEEIRRRLAIRAKRDDDASDADLEVYEQQLAHAEPIQGDEERFLVVHDEEATPESTALRIVEVLDRQLNADADPPVVDRVAP